MLRWWNGRHEGLCQKMETMVYKNCKFYGPYSSKKDSRLRCIIVHPDEHKQTISYPKYLMEIHLDRYLEENETVDHIDGNFLNNCIDNLQVLDRKKHCYNDAYRNRDVKVNCTYCGKEFTIKGNTLHYRNRKDRYQSGYFCSKKCSGLYGRMFQLRKIKPSIIDKIEASKYQVKSAPRETQDVEVG